MQPQMPRVLALLATPDMPWLCAVTHSRTVPRRHPRPPKRGGRRLGPARLGPRRRASRQRSSTAPRRSRRPRATEQPATPIRATAPRLRRARGWTCRGRRNAPLWTHARARVSLYWALKPSRGEVDRKVARRRRHIRSRWERRATMAGVERGSSPGNGIRQRAVSEGTFAKPEPFVAEFGGAGR